MRQQIGFAVFAVILGGIVLYLMQGVLTAFVLGGVLAFFTIPVVEKLQARGCPRVIAILLVFVALLVAGGAFLALVVPAVFAEIARLQQHLPAVVSASSSQLKAISLRPLKVFSLEINLAGSDNALISGIQNFVAVQEGDAGRYTLAAVGTLAQLLLIPIVAFLVILDSARIKNFARELIPPSYRGDFDNIWGEIKHMIFAYAKGQVVVAGLVGVASLLLALFLHLEQPFALAMVAALASFVPYVGPVLAGAPAVVVAIPEGIAKTALVAAAYFAVLALIFNFIYPKIVGDAVRLSPLVVIIAFICGFALAGGLGMFVAVPVAATLRILYEHLHPRLYADEASKTYLPNKPKLNKS